MKTYLESDWIEVRGGKSRYMTKVFLTDDEKAYMIAATPTGKKFFRVRSELLRLGEIEFFERVMESSEELPLEQVFEIGLINRK